MENTDQLHFDEFVKKVKPDANASSDPIIFMSGYIGESPVEGHVRVYHDEGLNQFTDIPKSAILHSVKHAKEENALGGSKLWVKQNAMAASSTQAQNMLQGDLYQHYANTMYHTPDTLTAAHPNTPTLICATQPVICKPTAFNCPSVQVVCATQNIVCKPTAISCPSVQIVCATKQFTCQPSVFVACPSVQIICPTKQLACQITHQPICQATNPIICRIPISLAACTITNPQSLACGTIPIGGGGFNEGGNFGAEFNPYNY